MADSIQVSIDVATRADAVSAEDQARVEERLLQTLQDLLYQNGAESKLARSLNLPVDVPVTLQVQIVPANGSAPGAVPVTIGISGVPGILEGREEALADQLGDLLFEQLRTAEVPDDALTALGYDPQPGTHFQVRFHDQDAKTFSPHDVEAAAACAPGTQFSWSKGCSSWPS